MTDTAEIMIVRYEADESHEGRDGRIRDRKRVVWMVVREGGDHISDCDTLREAKAYVAAKGWTATIKR